MLKIDECASRVPGAMGKLKICCRCATPAYIKQHLKIEIFVRIIKVAAYYWKFTKHALNYKSAQNKINSTLKISSGQWGGICAKIEEKNTECRCAHCKCKKKVWLVLNNCKINTER